MENNQMTIDDLAVIVKGGFDESDKKADELKIIMGELKSDNKNIWERLIFISQEIEEIKKELEKISKRTIEDDNALISDILSIKERINVLERQIEILKANQSQTAIK